jgi:ferredoxin
MNADIKPPLPAAKTPDAGQVELAMHGFVSDFGPTAALALESCVHCGRCAEACQFYVQTGDPKYTPDPQDRAVQAGL